MREPTAASRPSHTVRVPLERGELLADLTPPAPGRGTVIFAHGSGSGRQSPRNRFVAAQLEGAGFGTLLVDLLTEPEQRIDATTGTLRFDIELLADRVGRATRWLRAQPGFGESAIGYFGASTGAAAALIAAARNPAAVRAVVSRGGRADLAGTHLGAVTAATLLLVGSADTEVLRLNRRAFAELAAREKTLTVIPGAGHLFEEPGAIEAVARETVGWMQRHL
jgi:dienelactone hydrolase